MKNETFLAAIVLGQVSFAVSKPFQLPVLPTQRERKRFLSREFDQTRLFKARNLD
jgi:hypothetical protein